MLVFFDLGKTMDALNSLKINHSNPWKMRKEILTDIRQQPENLPFLTAPSFLQKDQYTRFQEGIRFLHKLQKSIF